MIERGWRLGGWLGVALALVFSLGAPTLGVDEFQLDKLALLAGYAALTFWWAQLIVTRRWRLVLAVTLFGSAIELLQGLAPGRQPDPLDALANAAGVLMGWGLARCLPNLPEKIAALPGLQR
ncbi:MAG: VanZ family protein [Thiobacillus sp.]|nr:VanZ family protein [Thiobacillus sp.]